MAGIPLTGVRALAHLGFCTTRARRRALAHLGICTTRARRRALAHLGFCTTRARRRAGAHLGFRLVAHGATAERPGTIRVLHLCDKVAAVGQPRVVQRHTQVHLWVRVRVRVRTIF